MKVQILPYNIGSAVWASISLKLLPIGKENVFVKKVPTCLNSALQESLRWHARSWSLDYAFKPDLYDPLVLFVKLEFILAWTPKSSKRVGFRDMTQVLVSLFEKKHQH